MTSKCSLNGHKFGSGFWALSAQATNSLLDSKKKERNKKESKRTQKWASITS
jgi:hypothetical protein